jgi:hypothetical protein
MAFNVQQPFINGNQNQIPIQPSMINPQGFTNQNNINAIYGQANPGTFTRSIQSPLAQTVNPSVVPVLDPSYSNMQAGVENVMASTGYPTQPPIGVTQSVTPTYDLANN